jgi:hypothetical protein
VSDRDGADGGTAATLAAERDALRDMLRARVTSAIEAHERDLHAIRVALGHEHESSVEGICAEIARLRRIERYSRAIVEERDVEPVEDLGVSLMRLMRSEARKETYLRVFELALLDGALAAKAHEIAFEASWKEWP